MRRREFIRLLGTTAAVWPLTARAQQAAMPIVAFLSVGSPDVTAGRINAFRKGLGEEGYTEDRNVQVEFHWFEGQYQHLTVVLDDLIQRHVAVMAIPGSTPISLAAKSATNTIPIVFGVGEDPVKLGLVTSLARPDGNATGINFFGIEVEAKRFGLMHDLLPKAARFAVLLNPSNPQYSEATSKSVSEAASTLGLEIVFYKASTPGEIDAAFAAMARDRAEALFIGGEALFSSRSVGATRPTTCKLYFTRIGSGRTTDELWYQPYRHGTSGRYLYWQYTQRCQARRPSGPAIDQVRIGHQSPDGTFAKPRHPADAPCPRRRGDRISWPSRADLRCTCSFSG